MTEQKHTPGPWCVAEDGYEGAPMVALGDSDGYAKIFDHDNAEANARLIAAAPDLLKALKSALRYIEVNVAYKGAMTAAEVEAVISGEHFPTATEILANSCTVLASFNFKATRAAITRAEGADQ